MSATHHQFKPESDAENETTWEPDEERKLDQKHTHADQAEEPDHGRHAIDRSRSLLLITKSGITAAFVAISGARSRDRSDSRLAALARQGDLPLSLLLPPAPAAGIA